MKGSTSMKIIPLYNNFQNFTPIQQDLSSYEINNFIKRSQSPNQPQRNDSSFLQTSYDNVVNKQDLFSYEINNYQSKNTNQNKSKANFQNNDSSSFFTNYDNILNTSQQNQQTHQNQNSNISTSISTQIATPEITTSVAYVNPIFSRIQKKTLKRHQLSPNANHVSPTHSQANENNRINLLKSQSTNNIINNSFGTTNLKRINISNDIKNNLSYTDISPITEITSTSGDITTPQKNSEIYTKFQEKQLKNSKSTTNYLYSKNINNPLLHSYSYNYNYNFTDFKNNNNSNDDINSIVNNLFNNKNSNINSNINSNKSSSDIFYNINNEKDPMTSVKKNMNNFSNNYLNNSENNNENNLKNIFDENDFNKYNYDNNYINNSNNIYNINDNSYKISNDIYIINSYNSNNNKNSYNNINGNINKNLNNIYNYNNNQTNSKDIIYNYSNNNSNDVKVNNYSIYNHKMNYNNFNYNIYKNQLNNSKDVNKSFNLNNKYNNNNNFEINSNNEYKSNSNEYNLNNHYNLSNINTSASTSINTNVNSSVNGSINTNINSSINNYNNNYNINSNEKNKLMNVVTEIEPESNFKLQEFIKIKELGKGTEGTIYSVKWKRNNKIYALKKSSIGLVENVKKRQEEIRMLKDFRKRTGSDGVIRIYGDLCLKSKKSRYYYDFFEIMELAEIDWDQEIENRSQFNLYYSEYELMEIMGQIVKTFALLQKNHITHRDIKPQNIMIVKGKFKICDFGNARILKREGLVLQRIRGSELYMSPIMFKGYHANKPQVKHNTFKSDVFSLGMCFLLAAALSYDPLNTIREIYDMNVIKKVMDHYLGQRYSQTVKNILIFMLQIEENMRPDFIQLERLFQQSNNIA